jgi:hypothetical protein
VLIAVQEGLRYPPAEWKTTDTFIFFPFHIHSEQLALQPLLDRRKHAEVREHGLDKT